MITNDAMRSWLKAQVAQPNLESFPGPELPNTPSKHFVLSWLAGTGLTVENMFDVRGFQLRVVGEQNDYASAEALAWQLDHAIVGAVYPVTIGGMRVLSIGRTGGGPEPMPEDDADRTPFVASYLFEEATGL